MNAMIGMCYAPCVDCPKSGCWYVVCHWTS